MSDKELFNGLKSGDRSIVKTVYRELLPSVSSYIRTNSGSEADARDIFQETLEIILLRIEQCDSNFKGLVMTIAKRRWLDRLRKTGKESHILKELSVNKSDSEMDKSYEKFKLMEAAYDQLSELCQRLIAGVKKGMAVEKLVIELGLNNANTLYRRKSACVERWSVLVKQQRTYKELFD